MKLKSVAIIVLLMVQFCSPLFAQQPTKEEIEEMKKMMEQMKSDPEMQKAMKQAGINMNTVENSMKAVETNGLGNYYEFEEFMAPKKDDARLATVPRKVPTNSELTVLLSKAASRVDAALSSEDRKMTEVLYNAAKSYAVDSLSGMANGLWLSANYMPALYIMGKACAKDPNADNLNNYAAFLVMTGGEDLALPILQKLNNEFPKNSTIQNNIGQAWFGLGELTLAEKYLDSAVMTIAWHPQANMTKAVIQESKGDKVGAIESLKKAVQGGYSATKEDMLRKLGYKLDGKDLDTEDLHLPADALGFDKWIARMPPFPKNHKEQMALTKDWEYFHSDVDQELARIQQKLSRVTEELNSKMTRKGTNKVELSKVVSMVKPPYLSAKAQHLLNYYTNDKDGKFAEKVKKYTSDYNEYAEIYKEADTVFQRIAKSERAKEVIGEGISNNYNACPVLLIAHDNRVKIQNTTYEDLINEGLEIFSSTYEAAAYYYQYSVSEQLMIDQYELGLKKGFLQQLWNIHPNLGYYDVAGCIEKDLPHDGDGTNELVNWNDLYCDRNISFTIPLTGTWKFTCNTTEFHLEPLLLPFEAHYKENLETNEIISASAAVSIKREIAGTKASVKIGGSYDAAKGTVTLEGGVSTKIGEGNIGPLPVKAGVSGGGFIEFDKNGVSDFGVKGGLEAKPDMSIGEGKDKSDIRIGKVEAGGKWSWNAGGSGVAKGTLNGSINPSNFSSPSKK